MSLDLIRTREELEWIAAALADEIQGPAPIVSRYLREIYGSATFIDGKRNEHYYSRASINKERMDTGIYTTAGIDDLCSHNFREATVARDLQQHRFNFTKKGIPLPTRANIHYEDIPTQIDLYDAELAQFTRDYSNTSFTRTITIEQRVIVNSHGGVAIQSVPHFSISYHHGYEPIPTMRELSAVCTSNDDLKRFEQLLQFVADPTPDHQIRKARNFTDAFAALHRLSPLRYGNLEDAGIPLAGLYDVVILTGTSAHEVFGHHFEELVQFLEFGDSGTFKLNQDIGNSK